MNFGIAVRLQPNQQCVLTIMDEPTSNAASPVFRSAKRRKILRQRPGEEDHQRDERHREAADTPEPSESERVARVLKSGLKKHGIAFASSIRQVQRVEESNEESAMVSMHPDRTQRLARVDRFVKPTGKVTVADDKHMTAFIDSKLAEMHSATSTPRNEGLANGDVRMESVPSNDGGDHDTSASNAGANAPGQRKARDPPRPRRQPRPRDPRDVERDSLVDSILRESAILPHYDHSQSNAQTLYDNEDAAAEAFKAQFLTDMEERKRRKRPNPTAFSKTAQAKGTDKTSHGPKLGGSRQQREKMKAAKAAMEGPAPKP